MIGKLHRMAWQSIRLALSNRCGRESDNQGATVRRNRRIAVPFIALAAFCAVWLGWLSTQNGVGVTPDSVTYIRGARNILRGRGFIGIDERPETHFPPGYSLCLAAVGAVNGDPYRSVRPLHAALFALNVALIGIIVFKLTDGSLLALVAALMMALSSRVLVYIHPMAWSEPLFLVLSFTGIWALAEYLTNGRRLLFVGSALCFGAAILTRYAGIALIPAAVLALLLFQEGSRRRRVFSCALFVLLCTGGLALWMVRNAAVADAPAPRQIAFHPVSLSHAERGLTTMLNWVLPLGLPIRAKGAVLAVGLFLVTGALVRVSGKERVLRWPSGRDSSTPLTMTLFFFIGSYLATLVASVSFADFAIPFDDRMLSPVFVAGLILAVSCCWRFLTARGFVRGLRYVFIVLAIFSALQMIQTTPLIRARARGAMYASSAWAHSDVIEFLRGVPEDAPVYSNAPDAIDFLLDRHSRRIPRRFCPSSIRPNLTFSEDVEEMAGTLREAGGVLVWFENVSRRYLPKVEEIETLIPLTTVYIGDDGVVYSVPDHSE